MENEFQICSWIMKKRWHYFWDGLSNKNSIKHWNSTFFIKKYLIDNDIMSIYLKFG